MAINVPMPDLPSKSFLQGLNTGSTLWSRIMQPAIERERMKQQQEQFMQQLALNKQVQERQQTLMPYLIQQYQDQHQQLASKNQLNDLYANALQSAFDEPDTSLTQPQIGEQAGTIAANMNQPVSDASIVPNANVPSSPTVNAPSAPAMPGNAMPQAMLSIQEKELRPGNPRLSKLDQLAGLVPTIPKPVQKISNGMVFTTYPSGRMTVQDTGNRSHVLHGPARDAADLEELRLQVGDDSPVYQNAKAAYEASLSAKKDLHDIRERTKKGLKVGEKEFFDEATGVPLGREVALTPKEMENERGNTLFNELYPYVYNGASPFTGEGSIQRLIKAAANYKTDPQARKLLDDYFLAEKMLSATAVNEVATLGARGTNQTYSMLKETLNAQDIPKIVRKLVKEYKLPASLELKAAQRYQNILSNARKKAYQTTPATKKMYYDPSMQKQYDAQKFKDTTQPAGFVVMYKNGEQYNIPLDKVKAAENKGYTRG